MSERYILIDCDETLVPTAYLYVRANDWCMEILRQSLGDRLPDPEVIRHRRHDIDIGLMELFEYHPERFPNSWAIVYRQILKELHLPMDDLVFQRLLHAARSYRQGPFVTYPGVHEALDALAGAGHELIMVTAAKYAEEFQLAKIHQAGLDRHFESRIVITGVDKTADFVRLLTGVQHRGVVVGDSAAHDIAPGLVVGAWTIKVGNNTWKHTHADVEPHFAVDTFAEVPSIVHQL